MQIIIFLFSIRVFACDCDEPKITEKFIESEFVANITILKIYPNQKNEQGYKADIKTNELFKGEPLKSIYVYGRSDNEIGSSCDIYIPRNTTLVVYARKNKNRNYGIGMCSGLLFLDKKDAKMQKRELEILRVFKSNKINFTNKTTYKEKSKLRKNLEQFKGIELDKNFGIYEIVFESDLKIKSVTEISGFGNPVDQKLIKIIGQTEWSINDEAINDKEPDSRRLLIGIYFYPEEKGNPSFLSKYY